LGQLLEAVTNATIVLEILWQFQGFKRGLYSLGPEDTESLHFDGREFAPTAEQLGEDRRDWIGIEGLARRVLVGLPPG
jgi:hypothetical protein